MTVVSVIACTVICILSCTRMSSPLLLDESNKAHVCRGGARTHAILEQGLAVQNKQTKYCGLRPKDRLRAARV